jgi:hypothetical protein
MVSIGLFSRDPSAMAKTSFAMAVEHQSFLRMSLGWRLAFFVKKHWPGLCSPGFVPRIANLQEDLMKSMISIAVDEVAQLLGPSTVE